MGMDDREGTTHWQGCEAVHGHGRAYGDARREAQGYQPSSAPATAAPEALVESLEWLMDELSEAAPRKGLDKIPDHRCGYYLRPDEGYCKFHEKWHDAVDLLASLRTPAAEPAGPTVAELRDALSFCETVLELQSEVCVYAGASGERCMDCRGCFIAHALELARAALLPTSATEVSGDEV